MDWVIALAQAAALIGLVYCTLNFVMHLMGV